MYERDWQSDLESQKPQNTKIVEMFRILDFLKYVFCRDEIQKEKTTGISRK